MTKAYQERILEYVRSVKSPVTTEQVAKALDISWQTAQLHLLNLANQDRINFQKIGRQNIFMKRALRAERNEYRGLFDSNPQPNVIFDRETLELLAVNDAFVNLAGFTRDDLIGMKMTYLLASEEDRELLALRVYRKRGFDDVPDGQAYRTLGIWNMTRKDGHPFLCEMMARPLQFDGKLANLVIAQPVQQIREPTMHPQEARFPLAAMLPAMLWTAKPDGTIDFANHLWYEYTGLTHAQTRENPWPHIVHPEDRERWESLVKRSKSTAEPFEEEFRLLRSDGTYRVHLARVTPVKDEKGRITMWAGCFLDHHKAHSAEQTVLQNASIERKFAELTNINRRILESTAEGIFGIDAAGNLTFMNPAAEEMTGW